MSEGRRKGSVGSKKSNQVSTFFDLIGFHATAIFGVHFTPVRSRVMDPTEHPRIAGVQELRHQISLPANVQADQSPFVSCALGIRRGSSSGLSNLERLRIKTPTPTEALRTRADQLYFFLSGKTSHSRRFKSKLELNTQLRSTNNKQRRAS